MKRVWSIEVESQDLLRFFFRTSPLHLNKKPQPGKVVWGNIPQGRCALIWDRDPELDLAPPLALVADEPTLQRTLLKLMAIPGALSPITAFSRAWEKDAANLFSRREHRNVNDALLAGLIGLIFAEVFVRHGSEIDLRRVGMSAVTRTFSHSSAKLVLSGGQEGEASRLLAAWLEAAALTHNKVDHGFLKTISFLQDFLRSEILGNPSYDCTTLALGKAIRKWTGQAGDLFQSNFRGVDVYEVAIDVESMSRESRLSVIEKAVSVLRDHGSADNQMMIDFSCGYILSLMSPGSLDFFDLALRIDNGRGYVACAYAMCAGLLGGPKFLWKGEGLGINIVSSTLRCIEGFLQTSPDVGLAELRIRRNDIRESGFEFRTKNPSVVEVELIPDITGSFSNGARREAVAARSENEQSARSIEGLVTKLDRVEQLVATLTGTLDAIRTDLDLPRPTSKRRRS